MLPLVFYIDVGVPQHGVAIDDVRRRAAIDGVLQACRLEIGGGEVEAAPMGEYGVGPGGWTLRAARLCDTVSRDGHRDESQCRSEIC